jgi:uncharacterized membrane-anchored protein YitT (DUF2179 family)
MVDIIDQVKVPKRLIRKIVWDYVLMTIGVSFMALSMVWFLDPYKVSAGGVSGIAIVLRRAIGIPLGMTMLVLNIPLFLLGVKMLGRKFGVRTLYGFVMFSLLTDFIYEIVYKTLLHRNNYLLSDPSTVDVLGDLDPLLAAIFGGILLGFGLGLVFRGQGSTAGSDIVAQIAVKYRIATAGQTFMVFDFIVISVAAFFFENVAYALIGFVALYISSKTVDLVVEGLGNARGLFIISDRWKPIMKRIMAEMDRGVTLLHGEGGYTGKEKEVIFCVITRRSIYKVRQIVIEEDPSAFMVITDLHEVYGLGFKPHKDDEVPI